jgi:hypothetical protein
MRFRNKGGAFRSLLHWPVGSLGRGAFPGKIVTHPRCGWGGNSENVGPPRRSHRQRDNSRNHFSACQSSSGGIGPSRQRVGAARNPSVGSQQFLAGFALLSVRPRRRVYSGCSHVAIAVRHDGKFREFLPPFPFKRASRKFQQVLDSRQNESLGSPAQVLQ